MERTYSFSTEPLLVCLAEALSGITFLTDSVLRKLNPTSPLLAASLRKAPLLPLAPQKVERMLICSAPKEINLY